MFSFVFDPLQTLPPTALAPPSAATSTQPTPAAAAADPSEYGFYRNYPPSNPNLSEDGSRYFGLLFDNSAAGSVMDVPPPSVTPPPRPVSAPSAMFGAHLRGREAHLGSPLAASFEETTQKDVHNDSNMHRISNKKKVRTSAQSRVKRSISTGSESAAKRAPNTAPAPLLSTTKPAAATQRVLTHKKSDQRRREALRLSFARLQAVVPQQSPSASPASTGLPASGVPASSASPPSLLNDNMDNTNSNNNNDDDDDDGGKGLNRVETMQATVRYIHALQEKNSAMDTKIAALQAELQRLKERQMHS
ncbi:hypothetical protein HDU77_001427 [Chytriomyces hyalinus]|nr:hypothetical protein HDU77_001427 [Chytriomyces hyalinus]